MNSISIKWGIEDVRCNDNTLSDGECMQVLKNIEKNHDANIGINWEVITCAIEELKSRKDKIVKIDLGSDEGELLLVFQGLTDGEIKYHLDKYNKGYYAEPTIYDCAFIEYLDQEKVSYKEFKFDLEIK